MMTEKHKKIAVVAAGLFFMLFCILAGYFIGIPLIRLSREPAQFQALVDSYGIWGRLLFLGIVVLQVVVAIIPGEPIELAAGYAFGFWEGTILTLIGLIIGSMLVFALVRRFGMMLVEVFFSPQKIHQLSFINHPDKTKVLAFILMLIPGTPKDLLSYLAGLTQLTPRQWLVIVTIGRLPSLITSTATGAAAGMQDYFLTWVMLAITLLLTMVGILYYKRICKKQKADDDS